MESAIHNLLSSERLCVLSVVLENGEPHGAAVHYSFQEEPLKLFIQTSNKTEKVQPFLGGKVGKAAVTIGFDENTWLCLQMRGDLKIVPDDQVEAVAKLHYSQHPKAEEHKRSDTVFLEFVPTYWKYTDYNTTPITIIKNQNE